MAVQAFPNASTRGFTWRIFSRKARLLALTEQIWIRRTIKRIYCLLTIQSLLKKHNIPLSHSYGVRYSINLPIYIIKNIHWRVKHLQVRKTILFLFCNSFISESSQNLVKATKPPKTEQKEYYLRKQSYQHIHLLNLHTWFPHYFAVVTLLRTFKNIRASKIRAKARSVMFYCTHEQCYISH